MENNQSFISLVEIRMKISIISVENYCYCDIECFQDIPPTPSPSKLRSEHSLFLPLLYINIPYPQVFFSIPPSCNLVAQSLFFWGENVNLMRIVIVTRRIIVGEPS